MRMFSAAGAMLGGGAVRQDGAQGGPEHGRTYTGCGLARCTYHYHLSILLTV